MRFFLFTLAAFLCAGVAQAEPMGMAPGQTMTGPATADPAQTAQQSLEKMSMDQQMAVCSRIEAMQKQGKPLTRTMQAQKAVCDRMGGSMDPSAPAPEATLER